MPDVNISYKGSQIASMEGSGVKTLLTSGKYCEDDIFVSYNKTGNATAEGDSSVSVNDAESGNICSLIQYGVCEQDAQTNAISCNNGTLSVSSGEIVTTAANREAIALGSQTATVENLYSVGNVRDEQELVTGTVTRKNAACIYDGTQPVGDRYISSTGAKDNGAIIIYPLETEHTGDSIVSFTETMKQDVNSLEVSIKPIQDLHGYANPWPAGGGVNQWDEDWEVGGISSSNGQNVAQNNIRSKGYIPVSAGAEYYVFVTTDTNKKAYIFYYDSNKGYVGSSGAYVRGVLTIPSGTAFIRFQCNSNYGYAGYGNDIAINYPATVTTYSPYSNICPISGRTGLSVYRTGKNLLSSEMFIAGNRYINSGNGNPIDPVTGPVWKATDFIFIHPLAGETLTLNHRPSGNVPGIGFYNENKTFISGIANNGASVGSSWTFSVPSGAYYIRLSTMQEYLPEIQLEVGPTATSYEPYNGTTYAVDWTSEAGTVYGGTVDVVTGLLTVDRAMVDLGTLTWGFSTTADNVKSYHSNDISTLIKPVASHNDTPDMISSKYQTIAWNSRHSVTNGISLLASGQLRIIDSNYQSESALSDFTASLSGVQLCYKLATPLTYQLTATQVEALVGTNNIFSPDATSIKVAVSNPVIEYVAPQPLTLAEGSNTVSATNLSVSSVPLELNYISKAAQPTSVAKKDINFIDYDGTVLYSYTASEFANLSALPDNPSHEGLVAQGWNWSLANAKTYVASYGKLWIGQMYITESGDTEIDIELHAPRLSPYLGLAVNGAVEVDWGDGTAKSTVTGTDTDLATQIMTPHVYATDGSYTIKIHVVSGSFSLCGSAWNSVLSGNFSSNNNNVYSNTVQRVRIGSSTPSIYRAFSGCYSLTSITIPSGVTSIDSTFSSCRSLTSITIPSEVTSIGNSMFSNCSSLISITIPSGVTSIGIDAFYYCFALASITIPSGVTSIRDRTFYDCYSLTSITIPNGVTSMGTDAFYYCSAFASITIPSGITSINNRAFQSCSGLGLIRFEPTTPPTVSSSNAWSSIPTDCIILIPYNSVSYIGATNYPSSSTYSYVGYMASVSGETLPTQTTSANYTLTWYATKEEASSGTGTQLTQGNGNEIYCRYTAS